MDTSMLRKRMPVSALFDTKIIVPAIGSAFAKLDPRLMIKSPVMFVVAARFHFLHQLLVFRSVLHQSLILLGC